MADICFIHAKLSLLGPCVGMGEVPSFDVGDVIPIHGNSVVSVFAGAHEFRVTLTMEVIDWSACAAAKVFTKTANVPVLPFPALLSVDDTWTPAHKGMYQIRLQVLSERKIGPDTYAGAELLGLKTCMIKV